MKRFRDLFRKNYCVVLVYMDAEQGCKWFYFKKNAYAYVRWLLDNNDDGQIFTAEVLDRRNMTQW